MLPPQASAPGAQGGAAVVVASPGAESSGGATRTVVVANTDGEGVYLRASKNMDDKLKAYVDGTQLTVTGPEEQEGGQGWLPVTAPDGTSGWVPSRYTQ